METTKGIEIGNWFFNKNGIPQQVTEIYDDSVILGNELHFVSTIKPIPLTDEILENNGIYYQFGGFPWWQSNEMEEGCQVHFAPNCQFVVKYVNELQNLLNIIHPMEIWL